MKPTLVILAAGMASRYGSMKQTEGFGPSGETIMDYSIYDAIQSGFQKVVFIIRKDFAAHFEPVFNQKLAGKAEVEYVYQELTSFTNDISIPADRAKPWGTAHAMLCAAPAINDPFVVINADDFYGRDAFEKAVNFLKNRCTASEYAIVGYELVKTLSSNGTVSRGVCEVDVQGKLLSVTERTKVLMSETGMVYEDDGTPQPIPAHARASMNFWCFHPSVIPVCETLFTQFLAERSQEPKSEFFITNIGDHVIKAGIASIEVIPTPAQWFGVTYKEDAPVVKANIDALVAAGAYPSRLW
jgi:hypothetical protein